MKTVSLKLNRKVLVIELPRIYDYELTKEGIFVKEHGSHLSDFIECSYTLLGSPDDLKEEDVKDVVEPPIPKWDVDKVYYLDYRYEGYYDLKFAIDSFNSALEENEIYWVNPFDEYKLTMTFANEYKNKWEIAQEKTFDRTRTLIFVEN